MTNKTCLMEPKTSKRKVNDVVEYILTWLCYGDKDAASRVAYTADESALQDHDVLIVPNGELGHRIVLPDLKNVVVEQPSKGKAIIRTDIVYNTFFFISRAEETYNTERDEHNRFLARFSMLGQGNRLQIPSLDEHARLLLKLLGRPLPERGFDHIYLTHDVDVISQYRSLRGMLGGLLHGQRQKVCEARRDIRKDPLYTFPWIIRQDAKVPDASTIYFIKRTKGKGFDRPQYNLRGRDYMRLEDLLLDSGARLGLHSSYYGDPINNTSYTLHRSHYLRCSIKQMQRLSKSGITDDFTMGFADRAGFRLQTTRAVRWINPSSLTITSLTLHPLIIMDVTLSNANYMNLSEDEACFVCEQLIDKVRMHHGDLCLLWHNSSFTPDTYHKSLYEKIIAAL